MRNQRWETGILNKVLFICISSFLQSKTSFANQGSGESAAARNVEFEQGGAHQVHCSRERSRAAWKIIEEYLMPFVEKEHYQISTRCRLHPDNDLYRDQEKHKLHVDINEWKCGYCKKIFYEEKNIDRHFDNRHYDLINSSHSRCLADVCGALHCDLAMDILPKKTKCNPAAASRKKHLCESLADSCFPVKDGPSASRLHELFLHQFCNAHICVGGLKPFSKGRKKQKSMLYIVVAILIMMMLPLFYIFIYLYQRGMRTGTQEMKRICQTVDKKKPS